MDRSGPHGTASTEGDGLDERVLLPAFVMRSGPRGPAFRLTGDVEGEIVLPRGAGASVVRPRGFRIRGRVDRAGDPRPDPRRPPAVRHVLRRGRLRRVARRPGAG